MVRVVSVFCFSLLLSASSAMASSPLDALSSRIKGLENRITAFGTADLKSPAETESRNPVAKGRIEIAQSAASLAVRVDRLETQMRQYTGEMEEMRFRLRQLQDQLQRLQEDNEYRFQSLEGGSKRKSSSNVPSSRTDGRQDFQQLGAPPQNLGSLSRDQISDGQGGNADLGLGAASVQGGPIDLSSMLAGAAAPVGDSGGTSATNGNFSSSASTELTGDPATDYDLAYGHMLQGDYVSAEKAFRLFVNAYPHQKLTSNAYYWLGESLFQQQNYNAAIEVFLDAYSSFPKARKAPDMLLKTGMALHNIKENDAACATYDELTQKFPKASSAIKQKARSEMQKARC